MPARTRRLAGPVLTPAGVTALLTVPAGQTWIVKRCVIVNSSSVGAVIFLFFIGAASPHRTHLWANVASGSTDTRDAGWVLHEGDTMSVSVIGTLTGEAGVTLHGSRFLDT